MATNVLFEVLIQSTIRRIGQVTGTAVQVYAEALVGDMLQHKFDVMFEEVWWTQFLYWLDGTLDGVTGVVTADVSALVDGTNDIALKRFEDIHTIFPGSSNRPMGRLPDFVNPDNINGTTPRFLEASGNIQKIFQVHPVTATGLVKIRYRSMPEPFKTGDTVNFDNQALILGAAFDYLEDDGTNPGATEKMSRMFEARVRQLKKSRAWLPHSLDPRVTETPDDWFVA